LQFSKLDNNRLTIVFDAKWKKNCCGYKFRRQF